MDKRTQEVLLKLNGMAGADHILLNEPMKYHTTMKVGGPADLFITPSGIREIAGVVNMLRKEKIPYFILGNGSNVICRDQGYRGAVICLSRFYKGYRILQQEAGKVLVSVKAGTDNKKFSDACIRKGLSGFEFASGIPGSIGGAAAMNAGAYDGEMKQVIKSVRVMELSGETRVFSNDECEYELIGLSIGDVIEAHDSVDFKVKFKYKGNVVTPIETGLNAKLRFVFKDYQPHGSLAYFIPYDGTSDIFGMNNEY